MKDELSVIATQVKIVNEQIDAKERDLHVGHYTLSKLSIKQLEAVRIFLLSFDTTESEILRTYETTVSACVKGLRERREVSLVNAQRKTPLFPAAKNGENDE